MNPLKPRQSVPALTVNTLNGPWSLAEQTPENFTMVVFYRGLHCPICAKYLKELNKLAAEFADAGVSVLALSSDSEERAREANQSWELQNLTLGYGVSVEQAQAWGLHRSAGSGKCHCSPMVTSGNTNARCPDRPPAHRWHRSATGDFRK